MPGGNLRSSPEWEFIGIFRKSKSKIVDRDYLNEALVSKKTFDIKNDSFFAALISFTVTTSCTPLIS